MPVSWPGLAGSGLTRRTWNRANQIGICSEEGQAAGRRVDATLLVERHHLLLHLLAVFLVLLLDPLDLRLDLLHGLHRPGLLQRQRKEKETDQKCQQYDGNAVIGNDVVEEAEDRPEPVDQRGERVHRPASTTSRWTQPWHRVVAAGVERVAATDPRHGEPRHPARRRGARWPRRHRRRRSAGNGTDRRSSVTRSADTRPMMASATRSARPAPRSFTHPRASRQQPPPSPVSRSNSTSATRGPPITTYAVPAASCACAIAGPQPALRPVAPNRVAHVPRGDDPHLWRARLASCDDGYHVTAPAPFAVLEDIGERHGDHAPTGRERRPQALTR